jgi:type I restriction enzyme S subunit
MTSKGTPIIQRILGKTWVNNHAHVLEPVNGYSCLLLYMLLKDIPVIQIKTGSIQYKINQENLNNYQVLYIPEHLRQQYISRTSSIEKKLIKICKENQKLIQFRDWLLPMLMNGQATMEN